MGYRVHRLHALDGGHPRASATGSRRAGSSAAPTSTRTRSRARSGASRTWWPSTRAGRPSGAPSSWRWPGSRTLVERRPDLRVVLFGSNSAAGAASAARTSACARRASSPSSTGEASVGRRVLAHDPLARGPGDDGLGPAGGRAGGRQRDAALGESGDAGGAGRAHARRDRRRRSSGCSTTATTRRRWRARARVRGGTHVGARGRPARGGAPRIPLHAEVRAEPAVDERRPAALRGERPHGRHVAERTRMLARGRHHLRRRQRAGDLDVVHLREQPEARLEPPGNEQPSGRRAPRRPSRAGARPEPRPRPPARARRR